MCCVKNVPNFIEKFYFYFFSLFNLKKLPSFNKEICQTRIILHIIIAIYAKN